MEPHSQPHFRTESSNFGSLLDVSFRDKKKKNNFLNWLQLTRIHEGGQAFFITDLESVQDESNKKLHVLGTGLK